MESGTIFPKRFRPHTLQDLMSSWHTYHFFEISRGLINFSSFQHNLSDITELTPICFQQVGAKPELLIPVIQFHRKTNFGLPICFGTPFFFPVSPTCSIAQFLDHLQIFLAESDENFHTWAFHVQHGQKLVPLDRVSSEPVEIVFHQASPVTRYSDRYLAVQRPNSQAASSSFTLIPSNQGVKIRG